MTCSKCGVLDCGVICTYELCKNTYCNHYWCEHDDEMGCGNADCPCTKFSWERNRTLSVSDWERMKETVVDRMLEGYRDNQGYLFIQVKREN